MSGFSIGPATGWVLAAVVACLAAATAFRWLRMRRAERMGDEVGVVRMRSRVESVRTWWALSAGLAAMLAVGAPAVAPVMAVVSFLVLRETLTLAEVPDWLPRASGVSALLVCGVWLAPWAWLRPGLAWTALSLGAVVLVLEVLRRFRGKDLMRPVALALGFVGPVYALGVARIPQPVDHAAERLGWLMLLLVLTSLDDMSQAWFGRLMGRRLIRRGLAPTLSPGKTWEGLAGGLATTAAVAALVGPHLVPLSSGQAAWVGLALALAGIGGDLSASWLKRRAGVKDSDLEGTRLRLPGHGGFLDRFDSLTLTAPTLFVLAWLLKAA